MLHHAWASTCSQKVRLALAEKGLEWEGRVVNLRRFEHLAPEFLELNPDALVPVLDHDGFVVRESSVINEYLDEVFPTPPLMPPGPRGRAAVGMWSRFIDDIASPAIKKPSFHANMRPYLLTLPPGAVDEAARRMPSRATADRWRRAAQQGFAAAELAHAHADLRRALERMVAALRHAPWLAGDTFSLADVNMAPFVFRMAGFEGYALEENWPAVAAWLRRVEARPAFARAQFVEQKPLADADGSAPAAAWAGLQGTQR